jgi:hypothetical protein
MIGIGSMIGRQELEWLDRNDRETGGRSVLVEGQREQLCAAMEALLVRRDRLNRYMTDLRSALGGRVRHGEPLADDVARDVLAGGLGTLDESALVRLLLNPIALWDLHTLICEELPDYWIERLAEAGPPVSASALSPPGDEGAGRDEAAGPPADVPSPDLAPWPTLDRWPTAVLNFDGFAGPDDDHADGCVPRRVDLRDLIPEDVLATRLPWAGTQLLIHGDSQGLIAQLEAADLAPPGRHGVLRIELKDDEGRRAAVVLSRRAPAGYFEGHRMPSDWSRIGIHPTVEAPPDV